MDASFNAVLVVRGLSVSGGGNPFEELEKLGLPEMRLVMPLANGDPVVVELDLEAVVGNGQAHM